MAQPERDAPAHESLLRLFHEGHRLESILSGWRLTEERVADLLIRAHRAGEDVRVEWVVPQAVRGVLLELLDAGGELSPTEISTRLGGRVSPAVVRAVHVIRGGGRGVETTVYDERGFAERFHDDVHGATRELVVVAPAVKGRHWRRFLEAFRRVIRGGGAVAFFTARVSELIEDELRDERIAIIEQRTHANLVLVDGEIVWEGSMNFLDEAAGAEHVRRTKSRLLAGELRDLHDLFL